MAEGRESQPGNRGLARLDDPEVGVFVLSEFIFCPRAGLCAYETADGGDVDQSVPPNLDYVPQYDLPLIDNALHEAMTRIWPLAVAAGVAAFVAIVLAFFARWEVVGLALIPFAVIVVHLGPDLQRMAILAYRQWKYHIAEPKEPSPNLEENAEVEWWELLKAGFRSVTYEDSFHHADWKLCGKPWRILRRGSLRVPVFRKLQNDRTVHPQHVARMSAYCHLIEECEGADSPYGIVLFGQTFEGIAIPDSAANRDVLQSELLKARRVIRLSEQEGAAPPVPRKTSLCTDCRVGKPVVHRPGETEYRSHDALLPVHAVLGNDGRRYHSHCGDRFRWTPPHKKALRVGLRSES